MGNVVVIDDSSVVCIIIKTCLSRNGISCIQYQDGIEAINAFKSEPENTPDLIFLDIGLPRMDGYTVMKLLKTQPQFDQTAVIFITGRDGLVDQLKSRLAGAVGYIAKPLRTQDVIELSKLYVRSLPPAHRPDREKSLQATIHLF